MQNSPETKLQSLRPGHGRFETAWVNGRTELIDAQATNPLRLLFPRRDSTAAWVYTSTYGGGLVSGDETSLRITLGEDTSCVLCTQASTKVYRARRGQICRQNLDATIEANACLVHVPDPLTCYAGANFEQHQRFRVAENGGLIYLDWLTSGRRARQEIWRFSRYLSQVDIFYGGKRVFLDSILLDPADGPLQSPFRLGRFHCMALMTVVGSRFQSLTDYLSEQTAGQPIEKQCDFIEATSPIDFGMVYRVMATSTEKVFQRLRGLLATVEDEIGDAPWGRKW